MSSLFNDLSQFNVDISRWDTSSVTDMTDMFDVRSARATPWAETAPRPPVTQLRVPASLREPPRSTWQGTALSDTNKVLIRCAWAGNAEFDAKYGTAWNVLPGMCPAVFTVKSTLQAAIREYNADAAAATNTHGPIEGWDVSAVTDMSYLFSDLGQFNADISSWDTSSVTTMTFMFRVRSARAPPGSDPPQLAPSLHAACATATPPHALPPAPGPACRPPPHAPPLATP
jgi:surface protein